MIDKFNRKASYLRLAITDRCNLRCRYCMPEEGIDFSQRKDLLSFEEIIKLAKIFKELGTTKLRITGGEPFSRKDFPILLKELSSIYNQLFITTNGVLIQPYLTLLKECNISGLNISLDTLNREKFAFITRRDSFQKVIDNIHKCIALDIPVKINCVVMKGINDDEIVDFIAFGSEHNIEIRFIEAMPFNETDGNYDQFMDIDSILERLKKTFSIEQKDPTSSSSAISYHIENYKFSIIPAYSRLLCQSCNRIRLTPKGDFLTCLYAEKGISLRDILRSGATIDTIKNHIQEAVLNKKENGVIEEKNRSEKVFSSMTSIGG